MEASWAASRPLIPGKLGGMGNGRMGVAGNQSAMAVVYGEDGWDEEC